jgi:antitoxin CptB
MTHNIELRRRRALWRATHRGSKELDLMIGRFAEARLCRMTEAELAHFEAFLTTPECELQDWLLTAAPGRGHQFAGLVAELRRFHGLA